MGIPVWGLIFDSREDNVYYISILAANYMIVSSWYLWKNFMIVIREGDVKPVFDWGKEKLEDKKSDKFLEKKSYLTTLKEWKIDKISFFIFNMLAFPPCIWYVRRI